MYRFDKVCDGVAFLNTTPAHNGGVYVCACEPFRKVMLPLELLNKGEWLCDCGVSGKATYSLLFLCSLSGGGNAMLPSFVLASAWELLDLVITLFNCLVQ